MPGLPPWHATSNIYPTAFIRAAFSRRFHRGPLRRPATALPPHASGRTCVLASWPLSIVHPIGSIGAVSLTFFHSERLQRSRKGPPLGPPGTQDPGSAPFQAIPQTPLGPLPASPGFPLRRCDLSRRRGCAGARCTQPAPRPRTAPLALPKTSKTLRHGAPRPGGRGRRAEPSRWRRL